MATRGDWKLGANGCRGASWSEERLGASSLQLREGDSCFLDVSGLHGHQTLFFTVWYTDKCTRVLLHVVQ